ncbi:hypothetical protein [Candidatus Uabimicrobium amorphum]|uniref:Uncharacterized protein n=1 Tax=Uabimicrobium amorphum TaxID=2596890 RepID=A0A5S9ITW2_UABAM|nr:hypothetical protein [Candidatus Uabimicrobium amorphum]BBM87490.1 hypothetical protein UABAM_05902 [Candidatus Uabimicrobium amorphum]
MDTIPNFLKQAEWVIQSASDNHHAPHALTDKISPQAMKAWELIRPAIQEYDCGRFDVADELFKQALTQSPENIWTHRGINTYSPHLLKVKPSLIKPVSQDYRIAIVIPGELRCFESTVEFLQTLAKYADVFICTTNNYLEQANNLTKRTVIVNPEPRFEKNSLHQWHKLALVLEQVAKYEQSIQKRYTHILKLRTDFFHISPDSILEDVILSKGIICASDKVFGGSRDLMFLFHNFFTLCRSVFAGNQNKYWPINLQQILKSDLSAKWYGMKFPYSLMEKMPSVEATYDYLQCNRDKLLIDFSQYNQSHLFSECSGKSHWSHFKGHQFFASEISFAKFLNFNGVPANLSNSLRGFLISNRHKQ